VQVEFIAEPAPVFVDASGRRGRKLRYLGYVAAGLTSVYAIGLGISLVGGPISPRMLLPVPGMPDTAVLAGRDSTETSPVSQGSLERSSDTRSADGITKITTSARSEMVVAPKTKVAVGTAIKAITPAATTAAGATQPAPVVTTPAPATTTAAPPVITQPDPPVVTEPDPPVVTEPDPPVVTTEPPPPPVTEEPPAGGTGAGGSAPSEAPPVVVESAPVDPPPAEDPSPAAAVAALTEGDVGVTTQATTTGS
jgi:hypothetical protein